MFLQGAMPTYIGQAVNIQTDKRSTPLAKVKERQMFCREKSYSAIGSFLVHIDTGNIKIPMHTAQHQKI